MNKQLLSIVGYVWICLFIPRGALAGDNVRFNYQGRVLVDGVPFTGTGALKLAIVDTTVAVSVWSNDGNVRSSESSVTGISWIGPGSVPWRTPYPR